MSIALIIPDRKLDDLQVKLQQQLPATKVEVWPCITEPEQVTFAVVWKHPHGCLASFPALKMLQSFGAGVDSILADPALPDIPLCRIVDPALTQAMIRYLDGVVTHYHLRLDLFSRQQRCQQWKPKSPRKLRTITILGLGELGSAVAAHFRQQGYQVSGWSRTEKQLHGIRCFYGLSQLSAALSDADIVICLLPFTAETENLLNQHTFSQFKAGAILINVARGAIVDDLALLQALDNGLLEAACLDVFRQEPLPAEHAYWQHPAVMVTPHISAVTNVDTVIQQIAENYLRCQSGQALLNQVCRHNGY